MNVLPPSVQARAAMRLQTEASDPAISAWVSANAGSGKTHVLARRVIRLLLNGVPPGRILCLTYTKAAAANMANRVLGELRKWVSLDDAALDRAIEITDGRTVNARRRALARRLFALALETPGGLKIQTIHAFCGALLHRFPFEAGVPAGFGELEEAARLELLARIRAEVVLKASGEPDSALGRALALLIDEIPDGGIDALIATLIAEPEALEVRASEIDRLVGRTPGDDEPGLARIMVEDAEIPRGAWLGLAHELIAAGGNCARRGHSLLEAAEAPDEELPELYAAVFLKEDGDPYSDTQFGPSRIRERYPQLLRERDRIAPLTARLKAVRAAERTSAALTLGREAMRRYETAKRARGVLDFADLVTAARRLLSSGASAWVHYKLDQGIDHVLVDEAQDTSPEQWEVIRPLVAEFFAGGGARAEERTLFVVGDEKQSIFSFQGADPRRFDDMRRTFERLAPEGSFRRLEMQHSFRSAPGILGAVDTVFGRTEAYTGLSADTVGTHHEAIHALLPALVEVWEPEAPGERQELDAWQKPLDAPSEDDPASRLARNIAGHIGARIRTGFLVHARDGARPARPGDFLVLVRRRGALFEAIIRALKREGVEVAGADRLVVAEHVAVQDLMALGDALISPDDELALACALKSPLFGLNDDDLIALAANRAPRRLDAELRARADETPKWRAAADMLARLRPEALALRPFDFYARVLGRERGRARMLARLGPEAADALDEMLALARAYERAATPSLAGFLAFLRRGGVDTKRDMEAGRDEVRVMTVHGAKGLEAPYVILADTTSGPLLRNEAGLLRTEAPTGRRALLLAPSKKTDTPVIEVLRQRAEVLAMEEYRRLLYVALTRAESALVVCGADGKRQRRPDCWYDLVRGALDGEAVEVPAVGFPGTVRRWRGPQEETAGAPPAPPPQPRIVPDEERALLATLLRPAAGGPLVRPLAPSRAVAAGSPGAAAQEAMRRGALMHRLLAGLALRATEERVAAGRRLLGIEATDWDEERREALLKEALATLDLPGIAPLFGPDSRAEVPIVGEIAPGVTVSGRIDRMAVEASHVRLADFKTDARAPARPHEGHVVQLALYAALLEKLFPAKVIEASLIYTAGPLVHVVGRAEMVAAIARHTSV
jgi:ATP-dependent helicase/nuclease subunit A